MARVKRGTVSRRKHKKIFAQTKGFKHGRKNLVKVAKQALVRAGQNAYRGRKLKKRNFRGLWIIRINAKCKEFGVRYSRFIKALNDSDKNLNRKMLAEIAVKDHAAFESILKDLKLIS